mmetsp:Transcript_11688/g.28727  ORF Transcript_11688/g.28727 Transcript_11688/m.28727 type:complete len:274 (+) Transcript_11688:388-1209(+)
MEREKWSDESTTSLGSMDVLEAEGRLKREKARLEGEPKRRKEGRKRNVGLSQEKHRLPKRNEALTSLSGMISNREAPIKQMEVYPNALEYDDADVDVSLPPELKKGKEKVKIWHEEEGMSLANDDDDASRADTQILADECMTCGGGGGSVRGGNADATTNRDIPTSDMENNTILDDDRTESGRRRRNINDAPSSSPGMLFACGVDPAQMKRDVMHEAREAARDIKYGVRKSIRNILGACDITRYHARWRVGFRGGCRRRDERSAAREGAHAEE